VQAFERGLAELEGLPADELAISLQVTGLQAAHLGAALLDPAQADRAHRRVDEILERPDGALTVNERGVLSIVATQRLFAGEPHEEIVSLCERAWGEGKLLAEGGSDLPTLWHVVVCLSWADALDPAEEIIEAAVESARREGSVGTLALGSYARAWPRYWRGDLITAAADAQAAVAAWSGEFSMYLPVAAYRLALALLELGQMDAAAEALEYPDAEERWGDTNMYGGLLAGRGRVAMARGDPVEAVELLEQTGRAVIGSPVANPAVLPWRSYLSSARLAVGDVEGARAAASEELELARRFGAPRPLGVALRAAGAAEGGERGVGLLGEAVHVLRRSPSELELARALIELGAAVRRRGQSVDAREHLREGAEMARRFGAVVMEQRAHRELLAAGAKPRRRESIGLGALTPGERRVAEMAAEGLTNRQIAQSLFVTVKAVQWHLRNAYRKLDVASREELPAVLRGASP